MEIQGLMTGFMLGMLLGVAGLYLFLHGLNRYRMRTSSPQEIDRLTEDFQKLFRQIDQGKRPPG